MAVVRHLVTVRPGCVVLGASAEAYALVKALREGWNVQTPSIDADIPARISTAAVVVVWVGDEWLSPQRLSGLLDTLCDSVFASIGVLFPLSCFLNFC